MGVRFEQQLRTFLRILEAYPEDTPLAKFLPGFFRENKQMGSTDRKVASSLLYNYFRLGKAYQNLSPSERLFIAEFLCSTTESLFLAHFKPELAETVTLTLSRKLEYLNRNPQLETNSSLPIIDWLQNVFPFHLHLSDSIDASAFMQSIFIQPDLFIRLYPGKEEIVKNILTTHHISFEAEIEQCLRLPNGTKLEQVFEDESERFYEVQDLSSQQTGAYFKPQKYDKWWDACAASGGKSILLFHQQSEIKLLVSDIRESVLNNLDARFHRAGLKNYQKKEIDLVKNPDLILHAFEFDGIILDAPCTGSGTWGRTPEMISQFKEYNIQSFQNLQKSIVKNVVKYLKPGKALIYITCSVFKEENEQVVEFITNELGFKLEQSEVLKGYQHKADTMYVARLIKI